MEQSPPPGRRRPIGKRFRCTLPGTVVSQVLRWRGWTEVDDEYEWDVFWCAAEQRFEAPRGTAAAVVLDDFHCRHCHRRRRADVLSVGVDSGFEHRRLTPQQRVNHFPRHMELTRKDLLIKNLKKWRRQMVKAGQGLDELFWPETYRLPEV